MKVEIFKVNGKIKVLPLIGLTLLPLLGSGVIFYFIRNVVGIYDKLKLPIFAPPNFVFMIVWPVLYILMGISSYRIYMLRDQGKDIGNSLFFYIVQLLLSYLWPLIFFSLRLYGIAFIELVLLFSFIVITFIKFIKLDKTAGILLIPYVLWTVFACVLSLFVWMYNEM